MLNPSDISPEGGWIESDFWLILSEAGNVFLGGILARWELTEARTRARYQASSLFRRVGGLPGSIPWLAQSSEGVRAFIGFISTTSTRGSITRTREKQIIDNINKNH